MEAVVSFEPNAVEGRLRESEERYRAVIENASDMIQRCRPDGSFEFVNHAWLTKLGYTQEQARLHPGRGGAAPRLGHHPSGVAQPLSARVPASCQRGVHRERACDAYLQGRTGYTGGANAT